MVNQTNSVSNNCVYPHQKVIVGVLATVVALGILAFVYYGMSRYCHLPCDRVSIILAPTLVAIGALGFVIFYCTRKNKQTAVLKGVEENLISKPENVVLKGTQKTEKERLEELKNMTSEQLEQLAREKPLKIEMAHYTGHPSQLVEPIIEYYKKNPEEGDAIIEKKQDAIEELFLKMQPHYQPHSIQYAGQGAMNRALLQHFIHGWKITLDPELILAILAMEARDHEKVPKKDNFICSFVSQATGQTRYVSVSGTLRFAINTHPFFLETIISDTKPPLFIENSRIIAYILNKEFLPGRLNTIFNNLTEAYKLLKLPTKKLSAQILFEYNAKEWKKYNQEFSKFIRNLKNLPEDEKKKIVAPDNTQAIKNQIKMGWDEVIQSANVSELDLQTIKSSNEYISPTIAHCILDPLHLAVGLMATDSKANLISALFDTFADEGVDLNSAIAAEQFYVHMRFLQLDLFEKQVNLPN